MKGGGLTSETANIMCRKVVKRVKGEEGKKTIKGRGEVFDIGDLYERQSGC